MRRVDCTFGIGYDCSITDAKAVIAQVVGANEQIMKTPEPLIAVSSQGENSVNIDCRVWCSNAAYWDVKFYLEENVKLAFDKAGITIPYPQMDVHIINK